MPVFDFSNSSDEKKNNEFRCTYTVFRSNENAASPEKPILLLDNHKRTWKHHSCGVFANQDKQTAFEFKEEDGTFSADILQIDARFVSLLHWLGENHINVRLPAKTGKMAMQYTRFGKPLLEGERSCPPRTVSFSL